jgi:hypothetical protein
MIAASRATCLKQYLSKSMAAGPRVFSDVFADVFTDVRVDGVTADDQAADQLLGHSTR